MSQLSTGKIKFFNIEKGYGFISPSQQQEEDVFFHYTAILNQNKSIEKGDEVEYELYHGPKGVYALNVTLRYNNHYPQPPPLEYAMGNDICLVYHCQPMIAFIAQYHYC